MTFGVENIKVIFSYAIASILILGGLWIIYNTRLDPPEADVQGLRLLMAGFIGGATQWVFQRETAATSARQTERATAAAVAAQPTVTTGGNPPTTTIIPAEAAP